MNALYLQYEELQKVEKTCRRLMYILEIFDRDYQRSVVVLEYSRKAFI